MDKVYINKLHRFLKKGIGKTLILILLLLSSILVKGQTKRVLFIGNSYTLNNNLPQITANIASSMGDQLVFSNSSIASYTLQQHSTNSTTRNLISQGGWDFVVLQEYSQYPSEPLAWVETNVYPYANFLNSEINTYNSGAETMFYMTWGRKDGDTERCPRLPEVCTYIGMDNLTRERYMSMAQANQAVVSPVGAVWRYIRENYPSIELYDTDGSHPSAAGSYAAACCFYTAIFRKDPTLIPYSYIINPTDASRIRTATKMVVYNDLMTWYIGMYDKFTITASAGAGGTINPSGNLLANSGSDMTFNMIPNSGYRISVVRVDNVSVGSPSSYTFNNITANHSISVTFTAGATHTIISTAGTGGTINPSGTRIVNEGSNQTYTISSDVGYHIADVKVDNISVGPVSSYTFTNILSNHSISVVFGTVPTYNILVNAGSGGSISPTGTVQVNEGANQTFSINANTGYRISDVTVDGSSVGALTSYTFSNITSNHTISASFSILTYTLTGNAGANGSINPAGSLTVNYGSSQTYTLSPNTGYQVSNVLVDNTSVGAVSAYTFSNVMANHTISASFTVATYSITASAGSGGSISPSGSISVLHGTSRTFTITPSTGYRISDVRVDNNSVGNVSSYTFSNISSNHSISATFAILTFTISGQSGNGGSITPAGDITVNYGTSRTYTITPNTGYHITDVVVDNTSEGPLSSYTFSNITGNHNISATFILNTFTITSSSGSGGSVSPEGVSTVNYGSSSTYTFTPEAGYLVSDVIIDNISSGVIPSYTFNNITSGHTVSVSFTPKMFNINASAGEGGTVNPPGTAIVRYGTDKIYTFTPVTGYKITDVFVDNKSVGPVSEYTFTEVTDDHIISVVFSIITFTVTAESNQGGSIDPSGNTVINYGSNLVYSFTPDYGYRLSDVKVDDISVGKVASYTFSNILSDHNLSVIFEPIPTYTISTMDQTGGSITPSGTVTLFEGSDQAYFIAPLSGYRILDVLVDNESIGVTEEYTFSNITSNHSILPIFTDRIDVNIYPNPFDTEFKLFIATPEGFIFDFSVADLGGKIIYKETLVPGNTVIPVNLQVPNGLYIVRVFSGGKDIATIKIVKYPK